MRTLMGLVKNEYGVYQARKRVPEHLQEAVARIQNSDKPRVAWLKRSLRTRDPREANILAKPILVEFDQLLARAEALVADRPLLKELDDRRIKKIADYHYAFILEEDEDVRRDGDGSHEVFVNVAKNLAARGHPIRSSFEVEPKREFGMTEREFLKHVATTNFVLSAAETALATGDLSYIADELDELLNAFRINLDKKCPAYRRLGMAVLKADVRALQVMDRRNRGEPVETPPVIDPDNATKAESSAGLRSAFEGWKRQKKRSPNTLLA